MSPADECCLRCPSCSRLYCRDLDEFCHHESPLCLPSGCCEREHERSAA